MMVLARETRRGLAWFLAAAAVVTVVIAFQQQHRAAVELADPGGTHINDFDRWMLMTPRFLRDRVDYVNDEMPTSPISLIVFAPFTALSRPDAQFAWVLVKLPLASLVFFLAAAMVARAGVRLTPVALGLMIAGWWLAVIIDMQQGQTNFLALAPLMGGLYLAQRERQWSDGVAGALVALGVAMKVTPVIFVAYFLWKRRWLVAGAAVVGLAAWLLFVPALAFGWQQNLRWVEQWTGIMIVPYVAHAKVVYSTSQSLPSFALRLLTMTPAFDSHHGGITESHYMNVLALSGDTARQLVRVLMIAVGAAGLWWMRAPLRTFGSPRYICEIGAVAAFMLWFSERTWVPHYVSFVLMLSAAGMVLSDPTESEAGRRWVRVALIAFGVTTVFASEAGKMFGRDGIDWAKAVGVYLWPSVLVTATVLRVATLRSAEREIGA